MDTGGGRVACDTSHYWRWDGYGSFGAWQWQGGRLAMIFRGHESAFMRRDFAYTSFFAFLMLISLVYFYAPASRIQNGVH
jgi:hypothetical protein